MSLSVLLFDIILIKKGFEVRMLRFCPTISLFLLVIIFLKTVLRIIYSFL